MRIKDIDRRKSILNYHLKEKNHFVILAMSRTEELWNELAKILKPNEGEFFERNKFLPNILQSKHDLLVKDLHFRPGKRIQEKIF